MSVAREHHWSSSLPSRLFLTSSSSRSRASSSCPLDLALPPRSSGLGDLLLSLAFALATGDRDRSRSRARGASLGGSRRAGGGDLERGLGRPRGGPPNPLSDRHAGAAGALAHCRQGTNKPQRIELRSETRDERRDITRIHARVDEEHKRLTWTPILLRSIDRPCMS